MIESVFYLSLLMLFYTYIGYPMTLFILSLFVQRGVNRGDITPTVTVIIPVHNEEGSIGKKVENCLGYDYPREKMKLVVVSDESTDRTEEIVKSYSSDQVLLLSTLVREGKVAAQNYALQYVDSEIIIFTDVAIMNRQGCVKLIVKNFNDKRVGAVSCRDAAVIDDYTSGGESSYIRYDMLIRSYASKIGSLIGVTGGFYAVRRELVVGGWNPAFPPDFFVALKCIESGLRVVEDIRVKAYYKITQKSKDEFQRKVRTLNRGMHALFSNGKLLNLFKYGFVSFELFCHKLLRWFTPFFLVTLLCSNIFIWNNSTFTILTLAIQIILYLMMLFACLGGKKSKKLLIFRLLSFFYLANRALLRAWYEFLTGKKYVMWQPTKR
jgi:Glycosyltransferases, probably involved in cell wall biogenesis